MKSSPEQTHDLLEAATSTFLNIEHQPFNIDGKIHHIDEMEVDRSNLNERKIVFSAERMRPNYSKVSYKRAEQHLMHNLGPVRRFEVVVKVQELEPTIINLAELRLERDESNCTATIRFHSYQYVDKQKIADFIFREYEDARKSMRELPLLFGIDSNSLELKFDKALTLQNFLLLQNILENDGLGIIGLGEHGDAQ